VEITPFEEFLRLTPEERLRQNDIMANRLLDLEAFMEKIYRGWNFIKSQHGNSC
jgi:hypothetical protein